MQRCHCKRIWYHTITYRLRCLRPIQHSGNDLRKPESNLPPTFLVQCCSRQRLTVSGDRENGCQYQTYEISVTVSYQGVVLRVPYYGKIHLDILIPIAANGLTHKQQHLALNSDHHIFSDHFH